MCDLTRLQVEIPLFEVSNVVNSCLQTKTGMRLDSMCFTNSVNTAASSLLHGTNVFHVEGDYRVGIRDACRCAWLLYTSPPTQLSGS